MPLFSGERCGGHGPFVMNILVNRIECDAFTFFLEVASLKLKKIEELEPKKANYYIRCEMYSTLTQYL